MSEEHSELILDGIFLGKDREYIDNDTAIYHNAPYSNSYSGLAVITKDNRVFYGSYAENAAFNPSVSPVESTLSSLNLSKVPFDQIVRAVLVEMKSSKVSQKNTFKSILKRVAPKAELEIVYCIKKI